MVYLTGCDIPQLYMDIFLKLKHWVLLAVILIPPFVADIADLTGFWHTACEAWLMLIFVCWLFAIGNAVYNRETTSRFTIFLFKAAVVCLIICSLSFFYNPSDGADLFSPWLISLLVVGVFFEFYLFYFIAKHLVQYENDHHLETKSVSLTFCLIWFFPIGVFFIQPRVNRIVSRNTVKAL